MSEKSVFKSQVVLDRSKLMHETVQAIMLEMIQWLKDKGVEPVITETVTTLKEDVQLKRRSVTHREGRAFDLRTRDWPRPLIKEFQDYFNAKYGKLGALSPTTLEPSLLVWHDSGFGEHFHVQFNKSYQVKLPKNLAA